MPPRTYKRKPNPTSDADSPKKEFHVSDKVFAQFKEYPPWPGKITKLFPDVKNRAKSKCEVYFYGRRECGTCVLADIHKYESNKAQFQKAFPSSKVLSKLFKLGLEEIENDQAEIEKELTANSKKRRGPRKRKYPESIVSEEELADAVVTEDENDYEQEVFHETTQMSQSGNYDSQDEQDPVNFPGDGNSTEEDADVDTSLFKYKEVKSQPKQRGRKAKKRGRPKKGTGRSTKSAPVDTGDETEIDRDSGPPLVTPTEQDLIQQHTGELDMDFTLQDGSLLNPNAVPVEHPSIDKLDTLLGKHPLDALTAAAEFADKFPDGLIPIESTDKLPPHLLPTDMTGVQAKVQEFENLKRLIEKGGAIPLEYDTPYSSSSSAPWQNRQSELINNPAVKYDNLRIECKMLALEKIIKDSLTMSKMNFPRALSRIDAMMFLDISSQMLIKNPEVIDTFRRLQRFNVHRELSGISNEDDFTVAQIQAALIRFGAERVCEKFAALFDIPPGKSFYEVYCADYEQRKSTGATKHKS